MLKVYVHVVYFWTRLLSINTLANSDHFFDFFIQNNFADPTKFGFSELIRWVVQNGSRSFLYDLYKICSIDYLSTLLHKLVTFYHMCKCIYVNIYASIDMYIHNI